MVAVMPYEKLPPNVPVALPLLVMTGGDVVGVGGVGVLVVAAATVIVRAAVPVPAALAAPIVTAKAPIAVGVPEMTPVPVFRLSPAGRVPLTML